MEVKLRYKQSEAGLIPQDWESYNMLQLTCQIMDYRGRTPKKLGMEWGGGEIPALSAGNVKKGYIDFSEECYFGSDKLYRQWMTKGDVAKDDILFTTEAPLGNVALVPDNRRYILSQRTILLRVRPQLVSSTFLFQMLLSEGFQRILADYSTGSTAKGIQRKKFELLSVALPPLPEQQAVAKALCNIDDLITTLDRLIAKKRDIKQATMQQLLTGKTRLPGFSGKWEMKTLGEVASVAKGTQLHSSETNVEGDFPHFNGGMSASSYTDKANTPAETIAISEGGNSCGYVQFISEPFWCGGHCYAIVPSKVDKRFLYHALKGSQASIMGMRVGSGLPNVQKSALTAFKIRIPCDSSEQAAIAAVLSDIDAELSALEARREKTRNLKQGMMQELLTGKTRLI